MNNVGNGLSGSTLARFLSSFLWTVHSSLRHRDDGLNANLSWLLQIHPRPQRVRPTYVPAWQVTILRGLIIVDWGVGKYGRMS